MCDEDCETSQDSLLELRGLGQHGRAFSEDLTDGHA